MLSHIETSANVNLTRSTFSVNGVRHELVTHKTGKGRVEVYREYDDGCGIMRFEGFYSDVCVDAPHLSAAVHPMLARHQAAHRDFWSAYLPGASAWLHAA